MELLTETLARHLGDKYPDREWQDFGDELKSQLRKEAAGIFTLLRDRFESLREHPLYYHYVCWGSGTVMLRDKWGREPTLKCRSYNGDFNCGCRACPWPDGVITGILLLTDDQVHYNTMLDRVLALLAPATEETV